MELFDLPPNQRDETMYLSEKSLYKDVLEKIKEKFLQASKNKNMEKYEIFDDVAVFSKGRLLRPMKEKPIDYPEIVIAPLFAGG